MVTPGQVALHNDGAQHVAVILSVRENDCDAVFFSSRPNWAVKSRRATRDEMALAGFVHSRATYLAYVQRCVWDFEPMGLTFPEHRVEALRQEFLISAIVDTVKVEVT